jgi:multiphosphoryl transfer protein
VVGIVVVSHSAELAAGVVELAAQMADSAVRIAAAGGLDEPGGALGTDAARVLRAVEDVWSADGVLVLMDLGSAVLSSELALDLLDDDRRDRVRLSAAPVVEGAVAAAVAAGLGEPLDAVAAAARGGLAAKASHLFEEGPPTGRAGEPAPGERPAGGAPPAGEAAEAGGKARPAGAAAGAGDLPPEPTLRFRVLNRLGLHARPAALLVRAAAGFDADVRVSDLTNGRGPVSARSLNGVATLGARFGDELELTAAGVEAREALAAVRHLADEGFGELAEAPTSREVDSTGPSAGKAAARSAAEAPSGEQAGPAPPAAGTILVGLPAGPGASVGPARVLRRLPSAAPAAPSGRTSDPAAEWSALERAIAATAGEIRATQLSVARRAGARDAAIFDVHLLFLEDEALIAPARDAIFARRRPAARAWATAVAGAAAAWDALEDPYQRGRAADLRAVGEQVLAHLVATAEPRASAAEPRASVAAGPGIPPEGADADAACAAPAPASLPRASGTAGRGVVVASDLSPADVAALDPEEVAAIACAYGGPTSHAVILARALGLPVVVGTGEALLAVREGTPLAVDGDAGTVTVAPSPGALAEVERRREKLAREAAAALAAAAGPAVTRDGVRVQVEANITGPQDVGAAVAAGADGVGLLRTEFLFLGAPDLPDEDAQAGCYDAVAAALDGRPLTVRTLDAGADKPLPWLPLASEANPFLGVRGLRLSLRYPEQFLCQLRAVLRVAAGRPLRVMLPMVSSVEELRRARELLEEARASLEARGVAVPARLDLGMMLEVPAAAIVAEHFAPLVDFFSVGTNDLTQYTMAAERGNAGVAGLDDPLHPAVLRLVARTIDAAATAARPVAVCGEIAGDRLAVPLLLGLGVREFSMSPALIPGAKQAVRAADASAARGLADEALAAESAAAVRRLLAAAVTPAGASAG